MWTKDKSEATANFKECYDKKLKINDFDKYGTLYLFTKNGKIPNKDRPTSEIQNFYVGGIYDFFV